MSFKSIAICKLPHSNEIQIYTGIINTSSVVEFELTESPQFVLTNGLNPDQLFWISGDVYSIPMNSSTPDVLKRHLQSIGHFKQFLPETNSSQQILDSQNKVTNLEQFTEEIEAIKTAISDTELEKVVAARIIRREFRNQQFDFSSLVEWYVKLYENYADCLVYVFVDSELGIWIGASPELLFEREESGVSHTVSLAGTLFGESEVWSEKEKLEQSTTSLHIYEILREFNMVAEVSKLQERKNGALRHLISQYTFKTESNQILKLIQRLNPTPAVIGYPQKVALNWVKKQLSLNRELYSGAVGIISTQKSLIHVNLRCAKVYLNQHTDLFAGCGINSMSDPIREWQETQLKSEIIGKFIPNRSSLTD